MILSAKVFSQSALELSQKLQCEFFYEPISKTITLSKGNIQVTCKVDQSILILNNTKVIPARLYGFKETGAKIEIFLLKEGVNV